MIIASLYPYPFEPFERHDPSATIIKDDHIYSYEEDKLTSVKMDVTVQFSERSLMMGCKELNVVPTDIDIWVFPTPSKSIDLGAHYQLFSWIIKAYQGTVEDFGDWYQDHVRFVDHQLEHASLAVLGSGFEECAFICQDGGGDYGDSRDFIFGEYKNSEMTILKEQSNTGYNICNFHSFLTDSLGFSGGDNGKVSGFAAYGTVQEKLYKKFKTILFVENVGTRFVRERYARTGVNLKKVHPDEYQRYKIFYKYPSDTNVLRISLGYLPHDIAATGEHLIQQTFLELLKQCRQLTAMNNIVLSGGLFSNVVLNNKIVESKIFNNVYIPMAASDAGLSLGGALHIKNKIEKISRTKSLTPFLGPSFSKNDIKQMIKKFRLHYTVEQDIAKKVAQLIAEGNIIGWFQGRGEYGPRSLGNRSILADPRKIESKARVNQLLKKRDWFMPFAPSILKEDLFDWVMVSQESPYMQFAYQIREELISLIPAAVHVDGSSRINMVDKSTNEKYWNLIHSFKEITGLPVVLNTSFNRHGIATISSPRQAIEHLLEGCMDYLAIDNFLITLSQNRVVAPSKIREKEEELLLKEHCIQYMELVFKHGNDQQISKYVNQLSSVLDLSLQYKNRTIIIYGKGFSIPEAIQKIIVKINEPYS